MQYRLDKKTGNKLSVLGFGCMRFPRSAAVTEAMIMSAIEKGVNYFDTAYIYSGSEETLGTILEKNKVRDKVFIATKLPLISVKTAADFDRFFNQHLHRLRTGTIDYYLMHMLTNEDQWRTLCSLGIEDWIAEKKKAGQIRQIGFSFHGSQSEFLKLLDDYPWEFCQIQYNYSDENFQAGTAGLKKAAEKGMPVIIMEPLLGGKLATGLPGEAVELFKKANPALSPALWGLKWVWDHEEATVTLSGMSDPKQVEENIGFADACPPNCITEAERETFRKVLEVFNKSYKIHCTGCNYCMPCPRGVNIPGCFAAYNTRYTLGVVSGMQQYITSTTPTSERHASPSLCVKCGACEKHCPQHLPIISNLEIVRKKMEPLLFRIVITAVRAFLGRGKTRKKTGVILPR
ncbi:MAG: aldo/keto reductase [Treponema sp.]|jgi:predicted aldo/keto reductase-like oxidoreductase|nr:aldo/keto reductase [Treponema sp.]